MKFKLLNKFLEGGAVEQTAAVENQGQDNEAVNAEQALQETAAQLVQSLMQQIGDPQAVAALLQAALEMVTSAAQEAAPTFQRLGGKLQKVRK